MRSESSHERGTVAESDTRFERLAFVRTCGHLRLLWQNHITKLLVKIGSISFGRIDHVLGTDHAPRGAHFIKLTGISDR